MLLGRQGLVGLTGTIGSISIDPFGIGMADTAQNIIPADSRVTRIAATQCWVRHGC